MISAECISCLSSEVVNCTRCCDLTRGHLCSAEVTTREIVALNHGIDPQNIQEKQTILIPAGKLSSRDKEILAGIVPLSPKSVPLTAHALACRLVDHILGTLGGLNEDLPTSGHRQSLPSSPHSEARREPF